MSRTIADLAGMQPSIEVISPEEASKRAVKAVQGIVREQGQVMSAALENNHALWHTNKRLRREHESMKQQLAALEVRYAALKSERDQLATPTHLSLKQLEVQNQRLVEQNRALMDEMMWQLRPELDEKQRDEALQRVKQQHAELLATGLVPTEEEINGPLPGERIVEQRLMEGTDGEA